MSKRLRRRLEMTEQKIQERWEEVLRWSGFKFVKKQGEISFGDPNPHDYWYYHDHLLYPDGSKHGRLPSWGLNNIFKWVVPKLGDSGSVTFNRKNGATVCMLGIPNTKGIYGSKSVWKEATTPALALLLAISEVIHADK
jgi:hypothetical protein